MLSTLEKVVTLQEIEVFQYLTTDDLVHLASITVELEYDPGEVVFSEGGIPDSMFIVLAGSVRLHQGNNEVTTAENNDAFGTWALFDDEPRVMTASILKKTKLLKIEKDDFVDLLADNVNITQGIMKSLVRRVRRLMGLTYSAPSGRYGT